MNFCESEGLVERPLRRLIVSQEHVLPHVDVRLEHGVDQPRSDAGTCLVWMNEHVLQVDNAHSITDHTSQSDERLALPSCGDSKRLT